MTLNVFLKFIFITIIRWCLLLLLYLEEVIAKIVFMAGKKWNDMKNKLTVQNLTYVLYIYPGNSSGALILC